MRHFFLIGLVFFVALSAVGIVWYGLRAMNNPSSDNAQETSDHPDPSVPRGYIEDILLLGKDEIAAGSASRHYDGIQFTQISIKAQLPDPPRDAFYAAFLAMDKTFDADGLFVGKLEPRNTRWVVDAILDGEFHTWRYMLIILETTDDRKSEEIVLRGSFVQ